MDSERIEVGICDLKARLSEYLHLVKEGEVVTIIEYGKPIGRLIPYSESVEDRMQSAIDAGIILWNGERWEPSGPVAKVRGKKTVAELIIED